MPPIPARLTALQQAFDATLSQTLPIGSNSYGGRGRPENVLRAMQAQLVGSTLDDAIGLLRKRLQGTPDALLRGTIACEGGTLLFTFAELFSRAEAAQAAVAFLEEAVAAAPNTPFLHNALGRACGCLGALTGSREPFLKALSAYDTALAIGQSETASGGEAFHSRVVINKAIALWQLADLPGAENPASLLSEAADLLRPLVAGLPENTFSTIRIDLARAYEAFGNVLLQQGNAAEALIYLRTAEETTVTSFDRARLLNNIGLAQSQNGALDRALGSYSAALSHANKEIFPVEWSRIQLNRGDVIRVKSGTQENREPFLRDAIDILREARETCTEALSPYLRSLITISLADALGDFSVVTLDGISKENAIYLYRSAVISGFTDQLNSTVADRISILTTQFDETKRRHGYMDRYRKILTSIKSILVAHQVDAGEWAALASSITAEFGESQVTTTKEAAKFVRTRGTPEKMVPPMPTREELKEAGNLYSQAYRADPSINIIQHLKNVWMPWIEGGALTQPELHKRDISAYKALAVWKAKSGNDLKKAIGFPISSKSDIVNSHIAAVANLPRSERPTRLNAVLERRAQREKALKS